MVLDCGRFLLCFKTRKGLVGFKTRKGLVLLTRKGMVTNVLDSSLDLSSYALECLVV